MFDKFFLSVFTYLILSVYSFADVINKIEIDGNKRISLETIKVLGVIELNKDYSKENLNEVLKNLYDSNFFKNIDLEIRNNTLLISILENPIIANVEISGIKNEKLKDLIYDGLKLKNRNSFVDFELKKDANNIENSLKSIGYYFVEVKTLVNRDLEKNSIFINHNVSLGSKAEISEISFIGNKNFKDRKLRNLITSEESRFWKFISNRSNLDRERINLDTRLIDNFYKNEGYYKANVVNSFVELKEDNSFKLIFNIDSGPKFYIGDVKIIIPENFSKEYFTKIKKEALKLSGKKYSFNKINKVLNEVDKIALNKQYEFIDAKISEEIDKNNINFTITMSESEKFYVEKINILGNNYTKEEVIRNAFIIDEGDAYNEILFNKSINKIKSKKIFKTVVKKISEGSSPNSKIIDVLVKEQPTGEISLGAGYGTSGATLGGGVKERNFLGSGMTLDTNLSISEETVLGKFSVIKPNFNYSDNTVFASIESSQTDRMKTFGYETKKIGTSLGTTFQQYENFYFSPELEVFYEDLSTDSTATASLKKQNGSYFDGTFNYKINYDLRDKNYQPTDGTQTIFTQALPVISNNYELINTIEFTNYHKISQNLVTKISLYGSSANTLSDKDVRISKRLFLPANKLRGFEKGRVGPKDGSDFIGGNYLTALNFSTSLPDILPTFQNLDFNLFADMANIWGVDYSDTVDGSSKIRSSVGLAVDYFSPVGPINFSFAQPVSKTSTDVTETFRFQIGTTF